MGVDPGDVVTCAKFGLHRFGELHHSEIRTSLDRNNKFKAYKANCLQQQYMNEYIVHSLRISTNIANLLTMSTELLPPHSMA
jgi:hypothetical protein